MNVALVLINLPMMNHTVAALKLDIVEHIPQAYIATFFVVTTIAATILTIYLG